MVARRCHSRLFSWGLLSAVLALAACGGGGGGGGGTSGSSGVNFGLKPVDPQDSDTFQQLFGAAPIPRQADWIASLPPIGDQGNQPSCVGWSTAYYVKTSFEARAEGWSPSQLVHQFSPAWVYNQINGGSNIGSLPVDAMRLMVSKGAATLATMSYSDTDFKSQPSAAAIAEAGGFRNTDVREYLTFDFDGITHYLATTGPLVFAVYVHDSLMRMAGSTDYTTVSGPIVSRHAIACVGYDLDRNGGSLLLANSWGTSWGDQGFIWVSRAAMAQIFMGAWAMVDGPNTGGGGGGNGAPPGFTADAYAGLVQLEWGPLAWAAKYRLERAEGTGNFQRLADFPADTFFHQDIAVESNTTYTYRIAALDEAGSPGAFGYMTVTTGSEGGASFTLTASHPSTGTSYPDRIALDWNTLPGSYLYWVFRSDTEGGFRNGNFDLVAVGQDASFFDDWVAPASIYEYIVLATDSFNYAIVGQSDQVRGATSGAGGGTDLWIPDAIGDTVVFRGQFANADMLVENYSGASSPDQFVGMGVEYYLADGSWGVVLYADSGGTVPILAGTTGTRIDVGETVQFSLLPIVPEYISTDLNFAWHFWYFLAVPLDANFQEVEDVFPWDNEFWGEDLLLVQ